MTELSDLARKIVQAQINSNKGIKEVPQGFVGEDEMKANNNLDFVPMKMLREHRYPEIGYFDVPRMVLSGDTIPFSSESITGAQKGEKTIYYYAMSGAK